MNKYMKRLLHNYWGNILWKGIKDIKFLFCEMFLALLTPLDRFNKTIFFPNENNVGGECEHMKI